MSQPQTMPKLAGVLDRESYNWLAANHPDILEAVEAEVNAGRRPEEIRTFILRHTQRPELAQRCFASARHIRAEQVEK